MGALENLRAHAFLKKGLTILRTVYIRKEFVVGCCVGMGISFSLKNWHSWLSIQCVSRSLASVSLLIVNLLVCQFIIIVVVVAVVALTR